MESEDTFISSKQVDAIISSMIRDNQAELKRVGKQLSRELHRASEQQRDDAPPNPATAPWSRPPDEVPEDLSATLHEITPPTPEAAILTSDYNALLMQAEMLMQIKEMIDEQKVTMDKQQETAQAHFLAIKDRDERSSRQNLWLTVTSSGVSLIIGWLLSLLGNPATVLHALAR